MDSRQSLRLRQEIARRRQAQRVGAAGFLVAVALPIVLWHDVISRIASRFRVELDYLVTGWTPWLLMVLGLLCFVRVAMLDRRTEGSRFYVAGRGAWFGWGVTLYLLGFMLATQVAQIANGFSNA